MKMYISFTYLKRCFLLLALSASGATATIPLQAEPFDSKAAGLRETYGAYIMAYYKTAVRQQEKYGIPASIILAQAILESSAGQSFLALGGNNHFGIKCSDWNGLCIHKDHEDGRACYRKYLAAADSYEDHSRFLVERPHYRPLFKLKITDYRNWAKGLKQYGYATDPQYAAKLTDIIETYELYRYDTLSGGDGIAPAVRKAAAPKPVDRDRKVSVTAHVDGNTLPSRQNKNL
ncbi:MAG: glucosaminidase domain-containing protein [Tannerella sp.]|jgi:flagellum-specific peptidoglycan hydrolase FlgJ|nr:glucosaminidase domain-containing protein [Tannerella sp.]